ncbi:hypothetical protein [Flexivirga meconopsidis]|uniref:hypothetical protein n=1 Tax=Flexivirga meconopsidis TaxID=2977121 RepID=UPI00223FA593|nr:hypothetical protein [Flexivirga meconopsidis]
MPHQQTHDSLIGSVPSLRMPPSVGYQAAAVASCVVLAAVGVVAITREVGRPIGIAVAVLLLGFVLCWQWAEGRAAGRRPWTRSSTILSWVSIIAVTFPMSQLIWPAASDTTTYAWVSSALAGLGLLAFFIDRWRG